MQKPNPAVDPNFTNRKSWAAEFGALRAIMLDSPLTEELKWGKPCYCLDGSNVAILYAMKAYCGVGFFKGALLSDPQQVLHQQGAHSQAVRLMRFDGVTEVARLEPVLRAYIAEAVQLEQAGAKIDFKEKNALVFPDELKAVFHKDPAFEAAFKALTPGRQRGYVLHFSAAKQAVTRLARIEKARAAVMVGKGLNDWR